MGMSAYDHKSLNIYKFKQSKKTKEKAAKLRRIMIYQELQEKKTYI